MNEERSISIQAHLLELRRRLMYSSIAIFITTGIAFVFHEQILILLMEPARGFANIPGGKPIFTELTEFLSTAMKASLLVGLFTSLPFVLYQATMFVSPGLTPAERHYLYALLPVVIIVFVLGSAFGYRILFPPMIDFLLRFGSDVATPQIRIGNYVGIMISLLLWMGVLFETPVVLFFLAKIGLVTPRFLLKNWRYAVVISIVLGAIVTPTIDPFNQFLVAGPVILLYLVGIGTAWIGARGRTKKASNELSVDATDG